MDMTLIPSAKHHTAGKTIPKHARQQVGLGSQHSKGSGIQPSLCTIFLTSNGSKQEQTTSPPGMSKIVHHSALIICRIPFPLDWSVVVPCIQHIQNSVIGCFWVHVFWLWGGLFVLLPSPGDICSQKQDKQPIPMSIWGGGQKHRVEERECWSPSCCHIMLQIWFGPPTLCF